MFQCTSINQKKSLIAAVFFSCILLVALIASRHYFYAPEKSRDANANLKSSLSFASLDGFSLEEKNEDKISFSIQAEKAHVRNRKFGFLRVAVQKVVEMNNVSVHISEPGNAMGSVNIKSNQATMYMDSKNILFTGNVICSSDSGDTLKSEELLWNKNSSKLSTENEYMFTGNNGLISRGKGFESTSSLKEMKFKKIYRSLPRGDYSNHG